MIFSFNEENMKRIRGYIDRYPVKDSAVYWCLHIAQKQNGFINDEVISAVSDLLSMSIVKVKEVASFYTMFKDKPTKKYVIRVCDSISCWLRDSDMLYNMLENKIQQDRYRDLFTLEKIECLGSCVDAPVMQINEKAYDKVVASDISSILESVVKEE